MVSQTLSFTPVKEDHVTKEWSPRALKRRKIAINVSSEMKRSYDPPTRGWNFETSRVASVFLASGKFARSRALFPVGLVCRQKYARRDLIRAALWSLHIARRIRELSPVFPPFCDKVSFVLFPDWMVTDTPRSRSCRHRDFNTRRTENFGQTLLLLSYLFLI